MPTTYAHFQFGQGCLTKLPSEWIRSIDRRPSLYNFGVQGPDLLFYAKPWSKIIQNKLRCVHCRVKDCNKLYSELPERYWESRPERVKAPYGKTKRDKQYPKYHETRETLWEVGGTTPQG